MGCPGKGLYIGEVLVNKGDEGDTFYVIQEGKVRVTDITIGSTNYEDQTLGPGDYFGERALVSHRFARWESSGASR